MGRSHLLQTILRWALGGVIAITSVCETYGVSLDHARIDEVVNNVTVLDPASGRPARARTDAVFRAPEIMRTGADSRCELIADDQTITRVGADTAVSFEPNARVIELAQGSVLFHAPAGNGGGSIRTAVATAWVKGATIIVAATREGGFKMLVLEGTGFVRMPNGKQRTVHGGQLVVIPAGAKAPDPVLNFVLRDEVETSMLIGGFKRALASWGEIWKQILAQETEISKGQLEAATPDEAAITQVN